MQWLTSRSCLVKCRRGKFQLIVNDTDAVSATLDVPYKANAAWQIWRATIPQPFCFNSWSAKVLYGSLGHLVSKRNLGAVTQGFMNDKTKFLATPGRVTSTMRAIMVSNNFSATR